ncbi:NfeD family protein [Uliginosibacterium sp. H3]|uniref:NfeD family protein n=1 Tax=Uliginosibacterium silvisoli TaxID=3114758 RepID=A0ABU6KBA3_9RHOO|nr:NfeD family protein [Uliginosibacterium sp. H3]
MTIFWVVLAVAAVVAEMLTGTLYLLVVGLGAGLGAVASGLDAGVVVQCLVAAIVVVGGSLLVSRFRKPAPGEMAPDLQGSAEVVAVADAGKLRVRWRGTEWDARADDVLAPGEAVTVVRQQGNLLHVARHA